MYEDSLPTVKRMIESIKDHVRHIFVIDGRWELKGPGRELSTDEVRDYIKSIPNAILVDYLDYH